MRYNHLTEAERYDIHERKMEGDTVTEIARLLERSKSTISRELRRNQGGRGYRPKQAHERARTRREVRRGGKAICADSWSRCKELIRDGYSPAQATNRAVLEGKAPIS